MLHTQVFASLVLRFVIVATGSQVPASKPNTLVSGKLIYVAPMQANLDQWLMEDVRSWGKYRVTANPEGVDLVIRAFAPEKETQYVRNKKGVPQPKKERSGPPAVSIRVLDWVTDQTLWEVELVDRKPKKDEAEPPPGPHISLRARGLKPEQIAQMVTRELRQYVEQLESRTVGSRR